MDTINQTKLNKEEWESIERACDANDKKILTLLSESYKNPEVIYYKYTSLLQYLKLGNIESVQSYDTYIYNSIFSTFIESFEKKYYKILSSNPGFVTHKSICGSSSKGKNKNICKKAVLIKIDASNSKIKSILENITLKGTSNDHTKKSRVIEVNLYILAIHLVHSIKDRKSHKMNLYAYLIKKTVINYASSHPLNACFMKYYSNIMYFVNEIINVNVILNNYQEFVIKNTEKDEKIQLYQHQKELVNYYKNAFKTNENRGSLVLYSAPTGTGKTMTPLCLLNDYKIIFICAARHVGLTLANYMINMGKKVGFAFGCTQVEDVRLHFNAVSDYVEVKKYGKKMKLPDHMNGEKVEIIISDIQSYYYSMLYMLSFNDAKSMILYWDEPTITLDYESHCLHEDISRVFTCNKIPNLILSSASLPSRDKIGPVVKVFENKFENMEIDFLEIKSNMNQNSVSVYDDCGNIMMPHLLWFDEKDKSTLQNCISHFQEREELQKFLSVTECIHFIQDVHQYLSIDIMNYKHVVENILPEEIVMINNNHVFKIYIYLLGVLSDTKKELLKNHYKTKYEMMKLTKQQVYLTSHDSFTITGGPCLYLTNSPHKLIQMLFKTSTIPEDVLHNLMKIVKDNEVHTAVINKNMKLFEDAMKGELQKERKMESGKMTPQGEKIHYLIESTRAKLKSVSLGYEYIPNYKEHFEKFHETLFFKDYDLWRSQIDEYTLQQIINIEGLEPVFKLTLMIGIGVLHKDLPPEYTQHVKELTQKQKLFMVIADEDYVYGTNYQFCHGYLGKDLSNMTQEKLIQSMGRIGRQNMNKSYSFRLRDNSLIHKIYNTSEVNIEVDNMIKLFK